MVARSCAPYPHLSVRANLSFRSRISGGPRAEIDRRVADSGEVLELAAYGPDPTDIGAGLRLDP